MANINVRKRGSKWEYRFETAKVGDKRTQVTKGGFATKKEAMKAGAEALAMYNATGSYVAPVDISLSDYIDHWMEKYCKVELKPSTIHNYDKNIRLRIKPAIGKYRLSAISVSTVQDMINDLFNRGYSRNTLSTVKRILSGMFRYAIEVDEIALKNPILNAKIPSARATPETPTRSKPNIFITQDQINEIFERFPEGTSTFIPMQLGYRCGLRIGEAFGLIWDDIDLNSRKLSVKRQIQWDDNNKCWYYTNPKYDSIREIEIDDSLYEILQREQERQKRAEEYYGELYTSIYVSDRGIMNTSADGQRIYPVTVRENGEFVMPRTMQHTSGVIHQELGIRGFTFHSLRHTHATMLIEAGAPINYVQTRLGHKNPEITLRIYSHITQSLMSQGRVALNELFR